MSVLQDAYPSRMESKPRIIQRQDPVVWSESPPVTPHLTPEQAESYQQKGYLCIERVFSEKEVQDFTEELRSLARQQEIQEAEESITESDSGIVRSIFRIHALSEVFDRMSRDPRLMHIAQYLLNDDVYIHQSRVNMKPGFAGKDFYWHSDFETWHVEDGMPRMRAVSCSIALTDNYVFNGPLMLMPGSQNEFICCVGRTPDDHYKSSLKQQKFGVPDKESLTHMAEEYGIDVPTGPAGSATFFECNTVHGSNSNITPYPRSNAFFVYNAMSNKVIDPYGGTTPRPEFIAARKNIKALTEAR